MNTNLNMTENRTNINNAALQILLASKNDAEIAEFEATTKWKWSDAVDEAILAETEANFKASRRNRVTIESFNDRFERETSMTYGDAVDMAAECRREDSLFGRRH